MIPHKLNPRQTAAVEAPEGPLLIVAGAGSGKTKTLTERLLYFLKNGADPAAIVAITFTNKAANEMRERVQSRLASRTGGRNPFIGTFHSLGARLLRDEGGFFGRSRGFTIYDEDDAMSVLKKVLKREEISKKYSPAMLRHLISATKNTAQNIAELHHGNRELKETAFIAFNAYEKELKTNNAFDFDDLLAKPVALFTKEPQILARYQNKFRYILVDEFQDVNFIQYLLIKQLGGKHKNVSAVGDDAQAIYGFRHADFKYFLQFEEDWPEANIVLLEENYRSTGNIITAASKVMENNKRQRPKTLWTKNEAGNPIRVIEHDDAASEAGWIASEIAGQFQTTKNKKLITNNGSENTEIIPVLRHKFSVLNQSTAILYRTNAQSRALEQALIEADIPYKIFGSVRFYERKEIKDIVACMRYGANPRDAISLERIEKNFLKKPYLTLQETLPEKAGMLSPRELIGYVIHTAHYFEYLKKTYPNAAERIENIEELMGFAESYADLAEFLEKVTLLGSGDDQNSRQNVPGAQENPVALMTIHIAKGLEFDNVFITGANEGLLPHQMSYKTPDDIEEERRLMYVAMTRAKKDLMVNFYDVGSRFLYEIPPELIEFKSLAYGGKKDLVDDEERYIIYD